MSQLEEMPKEFSRPEVVDIIRFAISTHNADQARSLGAAYLLEKYEEKQRQKEQEPVLSDDHT